MGYSRTTPYQRIRISEGDPWRSPSDIKVSLSHNGSHWSCFSLTPREARRLIKKLNNYLKTK